MQSNLKFSVDKGGLCRKNDLSSWKMIGSIEPSLKEVVRPRVVLSRKERKSDQWKLWKSSLCKTTYLLYNSVSGTQMSLGDTWISSTPPYSFGSHFSKRFSQYYKKFQELMMVLGSSSTASHSLPLSIRSVGSLRNVNCWEHCVRGIGKWNLRQNHFSFYTIVYLRILVSIIKLSWSTP